MRPAELSMGTCLLAALCVASLWASGCSDGSGSGSALGAPTKPAPPGSAATPPGTTTATPKPSSPAPPADGVELQKFQLTSAVKNKDPVDKLDSAKPGQRVYGHVTVRNRTAGPQRVSLSFRVNDDERSMVDLTIEKSWSWRSWAYVTLRKDDKGELTVHVFDDHGAELGKESIPIK